MSATVAGAIKTVLEAAGLGLAVYRLTPPQGAALPYAVVSVEAVTAAERARGDVGEAGRPRVLAQTVQLDVWQARTGEQPGLPDRVWAALDGALLPPVGAGGCWPCTASPAVDASALSVDPERVRHIITATVTRQVA